MIFIWEKWTKTMQDNSDEYKQQINIYKYMANKYLHLPVIGKNTN